jgi:hypothetical protein
LIHGEDSLQDLANGVFEGGILGVHRENGLNVVAIPRLPVCGNDLFEQVFSGHRVPLSQKQSYA